MIRTGNHPVYIYLPVLPQQEVTIRDRISLQLAERSPGLCRHGSSPPAPGISRVETGSSSSEEGERCVMRVTEKLPEASSSGGE